MAVQVIIDVKVNDDGEITAQTVKAGDKADHLEITAATVMERVALKAFKLMTNGMAGDRIAIKRFLEAEPERLIEIIGSM